MTKPKGKTRDEIYAEREKIRAERNLPKITWIHDVEECERAAYAEKAEREYVPMTAEQRSRNGIQLYIHPDLYGACLVYFNNESFTFDVDNWRPVIEFIDFLNRQMNPDSVPIIDFNIEAIDSNFIGEVK